MLKSLLVLIAVSMSVPAFASIQTVCGTRAGRDHWREVRRWTPGSPRIVDSSSGITLVKLTPRLLKQVDSFMREPYNDETSTISGDVYCLNLQVGAKGAIRKIVGAYNVNERIQTLCGTRREVSSEIALVNAQGAPVFVLASRDGDRRFLAAVDQSVAGGTREGQAYCANVRFDRENPATPIEVVDAFVQQ